jgi:7-cyano-7-deazaguanine reductase
MESDISQAAGCKISVNLIPIATYPSAPLTEWSGIDLDHLDISTDVYDVNPAFLKTETSTVTETVYSHLLKSNCLVTGQPDWGSLLIRYHGKKINHEGLLKYIVSFRNHTEFGEHCVERIYMDITQHCQPEKLTVYARYTRRGGLDLNPFRSNFEQIPAHERLNRQ